MGRYRGSRKPPGQKKPPLTHFLCLPLVTPDSRPQLQASMQRFRDALASETTSEHASSRSGGAPQDGDEASVVPGVHPKAIRPVGALHFTLGVMSLNKDKLADAVEFLKLLDVAALLRDAGNQRSSDAASTDPEAPTEQSGNALASTERPVSPPALLRSRQPIKIDLRGIESMHAPSKTSILYCAPFDSSERLYPFCAAVQKLFQDQDFLVPDDRKLKLHATVVNTIYAKGKKRPARQHARPQTPELDPEKSTMGGGEVKEGQVEPHDDRSQGHGLNANAPLKIDATAILEKFRDFVWAEDVVLDRLAICEMGAKKVMGADGRVIREEYTEVASVRL